MLLYHDESMPGISYRSQVCLAAVSTSVLVMPEGVKARGKRITPEVYSIYFGTDTKSHYYYHLTAESCDILGTTE